MVATRFPMSELRLVITAFVILSTSACTITKQYTADEIPSGSYDLIVMPASVAVYTLVGPGQVEPNEDWTTQAGTNVFNALVHYYKVNRIGTRVAKALQDANTDFEELDDLNMLHNIVGKTISVHKYFGEGVNLPTKENVFDWTLGNKAVEYGIASGYDYALFVHVETSFATAGVKTLRAMGWILCGTTGACLLVPGGEQIAFASLVDLSTGRIVWFNRLKSGVGDIRKSSGADEMISRLLQPLQTQDRTR